MKKIINYFKNLSRKRPRLNMRNNTFTKILSLILAIFFWVYAMDQVNPEVTYTYENIPVTLLNTVDLVQNEYVIMNQTDYFADVSVVGRRNDVLSIEDSDINLSADLKGAHRGQNIIPVKSSLNKDNASITNVDPSSIIVSVEQVIKSPKSAKVTTQGKLAGGYSLNSVTIEPDEVILTGPESLVRSVSYMLGQINIEGKSEDFTKEIPIVPVDASGNPVSGVTSDIEYVRVNVKIDKTNSVEVQTNIVGEVAPDYKITNIAYSPDVFFLSGDPEVVNQYTTIYTEDIVLEGTETLTFKKTIPLIIPEGTSLYNQSETCDVTVTIEPVISKEFVYQINELPILNLDNQFESNLALNEDVFTVKITDAKSIVNDISRSDLEPYIDAVLVDNPGVFTLPIKIDSSITSTVEDFEMAPTSIELEITQVTQSDTTE